MLNCYSTQLPQRISGNRLVNDRDFCSKKRHHSVLHLENTKMRTSIIFVLVALTAIVAADAHKLRGNQGGQQGGQQGGSQGSQQGGQQGGAQGGPLGGPQGGPWGPNNSTTTTEASDTDSTTTEASTSTVVADETTTVAT
ncbi:merozoite surface protein 2-like [Drosophila sulfurigaster albostrigata]|uniref:merozoite surface protein 2-like n=1 Tax=Drosophila sulfurigaster albostrigata TaxID=89887 RepID=UPI002D219391|nr:merozoite surface protein 2-like [Drosophila sulfurigaster albostrigata]